MAAADQPMGAAASGRKLGPYWRRRLGMTNPGEMTGAQLQRINLIRRAQGLQPVGGRVGFDTPQAATEGAGPGGNPAGAASPLQLPRLPDVGAEGAGPGGNPAGAAGPNDLVGQYRQILDAVHGLNPGGPMRGAGGMTSGDTFRPVEGESQIDEAVDPGFMHARGGSGGVANLRDMLLRRLTGAAPPLTSAAALRRVAVGRRGARPILPPRKALPAAGRKLPY